MTSSSRSAPRIPKAFISYSHDTLEHKRWVLELATRLRNNGVDASIDQWDLRPGDDLPVYMERSLTAADRVIMVCTESYVTKANSGAGGVGYEKMIVTAELLKSIDSNKVIPIIRQGGSHLVPTFLKSKLYLDFSRSEQFDFSFDELLRTIHDAPLFAKPPIGNRPFTPVSASPPEPTGDSLREVMRLIVSMFEDTTTQFVLYSKLLSRSPISRLLLDIQLEEAATQGLLRQDSDGDVWLLPEGKKYALNHRLYGGAQ